MTIANNITGVGVAYNIDTNGNDVTITGSVSGGGLDKEGAGTLTLWPTRSTRSLVSC